MKATAPMLPYNHLAGNNPPDNHIEVKGNYRKEDMQKVITDLGVRIHDEESSAIGARGPGQYPNGPDAILNDQHNEARNGPSLSRFDFGDRRNHLASFVDVVSETTRVINAAGGSANGILQKSFGGIGNTRSYDNLHEKKVNGDRTRTGKNTFLFTSDSGANGRNQIMEPYPQNNVFKCQNLVLGLRNGNTNKFEMKDVALYNAHMKKFLFTYSDIMWSNQGSKPVPIFISSSRKEILCASCDADKPEFYFSNNKDGIRRNVPNIDGLVTRHPPVLLGSMADQTISIDLSAKMVSLVTHGRIDRFPDFSANKTQVTHVGDRIYLMYVLREMGNEENQAKIELSGKRYTPSKTAKFYFRYEFLYTPDNAFPQYLLDLSMCRPFVQKIGIVTSNFGNSLESSLVYNSTVNTALYTSSKYLSSNNSQLALPYVQILFKM